METPQDDDFYYLSDNDYNLDNEDNLDINDEFSIATQMALYENIIKFLLKNVFY